MATRPASMERWREAKSALPTPASEGRTTSSAPASSSRLMLWPMMAKVCSNRRKVSLVALPSGALEMSTAITSSAPICRAWRTGTGATRPPSTYSRPAIGTGRNTPGTALEARTAVPVSPRRNTMPSPCCRSVATTPSGRGICSSSLPPTCWLT